MTGATERDVESAVSDSPAIKQDAAAQPRTPGGWRAVFFIIGNESFERLASMSLIMNLSVYLQTKYNLVGVFLINVVSIWSGCCNVLPLLGAFIAEKFLGRFGTLLLGCTASFLGMGMMTLTAGIPGLRPSDCGISGQPHLDCPQPNSGHLTFLYVALGLLAIGAGAIRPCCIAFGADQFKASTEEGRKAMQSFYNWWYLSFTLTLIVALSAVVYIQTRISWVIGLAIPTACLAVSVVIFLIGRPTYVVLRPHGCVYSDMAKVVASSIKKRRLDTRYTSSLSFYDPPTLESDAHIKKLPHTDRFKFLDKGAVIVDPSELNSQGKPKSSWRLCSLQQSEQLKSLVAIAPVWVSGIGCFLVMDQQATNGVLQAIQSNQSVGKNFKIPPAWVGLTSMIVLSIWIFLYEFVAGQVSRKLYGKRFKRLTVAQRMNIGIVMSVAAMVIAGTVERKRRQLAVRAGSVVSPLSTAYLLPQSALAGLVEAFAAIAVMELLTSHVPENLRTVGGAIYFLSMSIASYITSATVSIVHTLSGKDGRDPWVGGKDLNTGRLDYYYYIIAGMSGLNLIYFNLYARKFLKDELNNDSIDGVDTPNADSKHKS